MAGQTSLTRLLRNDSDCLITVNETVMDPYAGNSLLQTLGQSFHMGAIKQIDSQIDINEDRRERQRRKQHLAG